MFSIIIPLYNKEKSCARSIQSVLNQKYCDWELIIVNDGSTDNSLEVAQKSSKADSRVRFINQSNRGVSAARNLGIKAAKSENIAFLDADDFWHPQYLEIMAKVIDEYPDYLWWGSDYNKADENTIKQYYNNNTVFSWNPENIVVLDYFKESISRLCINMDSIIMQKSTLLEIGGFPEGVIYCEDQDLFSRYAMKSKLPRISYKLTFYSLNTANSICAMIKNQRLDIPLMPFIKENIALLSSAKCHKNDDIYWVQEYVCDRFLVYIWKRYRMGYLTWPSFMYEINKCRNTRESRLFLLFTMVLSLIPRRFHSILGKAWPSKIPHFRAIRTDR